MRWSGVVLLTAFCLGFTLAYKSYDGYQVLKTREVPEFSIKALVELRNNPDYDFWARPGVGRPALIMAAPEHIDILRDALHRLRLNPTVHIQDVGAVLRHEREEIESIKSKEVRSPKAATYDRYMDYTEIMDFVHGVIADNPSIASELDVGVSYEGRALHGVKISSGPGKKAIFMDCAIHAREWISPPVCMKTIEDVIASPELQGLADWYILPVANPDGYSYAWTDARLWRKTRSPNAGSSCVGTDPNRNFDILWNTDNNNFKCGETYPGATAFSEIECASIGNVLNTMGNSGELLMYLTMHSYGPMILYPRGYTNEPPANVNELAAAAQECADTIKSIGGTPEDYYVGAAYTLYYTYGASDDYAFDVGNVEYVYTFELPGGGPNGFDPPSSLIKPVIDETVPALLNLARRAVANSSK